MGEIEATVPVQRGVAGGPRIPVVPGFARRAAVAGGSASQSPKGAGKALRERVPRASHSSLVLPAGRPDAVRAVEESSRGRVPALAPIRVGRMAATPFAFLRGSAGLMAHDLTGSPVSGVGAQLCGDAHAANFGLYGDARGSLVIDLNDFDETVFGPWEWDLKRLAASMVLAGREAGADEDTCRRGAYDTVGAYRRTMRLLARLPPPVLRRVPDEEAAAVAAGLRDYLGTISEDRVPLLARYAIHDVAFRVVGTGSVGTRSYVVLLLDHRGEPLVLQVKEARPSALAPYLPAVGFDVPEVAHEGRRVVLGQKRMQVVSDILLGWATVGGRHFQVRQFRNRKGSVDPAALTADQVDDYGRMTGALLARAHAHSADPRLIAGYCGKNEELDEAVAAFAVMYADRTESDHAELVRAVGAGRIAAETGV
ncbi:DUF2252 domain-containing protein [Streptomyces sp. NPDC094048]|uniref:DUF2252 domain-containing protein n=1 Tax=Streptomyces sp. NPDC094048 TaxID=3155207 RepID=UPI0033179875